MARKKQIANEQDGYDSRRPVTIYNPYPPSLWPHKLGTKVYYLVTRLVVGAPFLAVGTVSFYNPTTRSTASSGKDNATYTVDVVEGDFGTAQVVGAKFVAPFDPEGRKLLLDRKADILDKHADDFRHYADECDKLAKQARVGREPNVPRGRKDKRRAEAKIDSPASCA